MTSKHKKLRKPDLFRDQLEWFLAWVLGRTSWPVIEATLESHLAVAAAGITPTAPGGGYQAMSRSSYAMVSYEVAGKIYSAAIPEIAAPEATFPSPGHTILIRYNPAHPSRAYYPPACTLASKFILLMAIVVTVSGFLFAIYRERSGQQP